MPTPDVTATAIAMKALIEPWVHTNMALLSDFYYEGQWHIGDENTAWYLGPCAAALAATMYRYATPRDTAFRDIAIETVEQGFIWNASKDPIYRASVYSYPRTPNYPNSLLLGIPAASRFSTQFDGGPWGNPDLIGSDENGTIEIVATFSWILDELYAAGGIDKWRALRWLRKLKLAADWLIDINGNPTWYTNGNYVAHQALAYATLLKCCRTLGDEVAFARYKEAYEQSMQTLLYPFGNNPPANAQWANYGYTVTVPGSGSTGTGTGPSVAALLNVNGTTSDGSTEQGHTTETSTHSVITPGVTPTFDGVYSQLTLDCLTTLYLVNRDWRVNYVMNALWNKLETISNFSTNLVDCTGGSRQTGIRGWTGGYQNVIAMIGRRTSNRTNITQAVCQSTWSGANGMAANLTANGNVAINQIQSSTIRQWRIAIATTLKTCYVVAPKVT